MGPTSRRTTATAGRGFPAVCEALADAWKNDRERVVEQAGRLREHIAREGGERAVGDLHPEVIGAAADQLARRYDSAWGGFGDAPKFLHTMELRLLLRHWLSSGDATVLEMVTHTLDRMAAGGLYDQLGGAFHRYSTDEQWLIPHFEKMLYDNALMVPLYLEAHLATRNGAAGNGDYARIARECCEWVLREMVTPEGGFASSQDADSEGEEGKFFAWTPDELTAVLGAKRGLWAAEWYGVTDEGNFEHGKSALWRKHPAEQVAARLGVEQAELEGAMREARLALFAARAKRVAPGTDDKVLAAWNGLMIGAMAQAYQVLDEPRYLDAARAAARYVLEGMRQEDGRLFATARHGRAHLNAYLDDYAFMIQGLIDLYESDFDPRWLREALTLNEVVLEHFDDPELGGFYTTGDNHEQLIARLKAPMDGALPSGNGVMALNLLRLAELTGRGPLAKEAERTIRSRGRKRREPVPATVQPAPDGRRFPGCRAARDRRRRRADAPRGPRHAGRDPRPLPSPACRGPGPRERGQRPDPVARGPLRFTRDRRPRLRLPELRLPAPGRHRGGAGRAAQGRPLDPPEPR